MVSAVPGSSRVTPDLLTHSIVRSVRTLATLVRLAAVGTG